MLADLGVGYIIYRVAAFGYLVRPRSVAKPGDLTLEVTKRALIMSALWVLNPAVILISSVWGQVESLFTVFLLLSLLLLREKKLLASYLLFGVAIIVKAQSLFLAPVYLYSAFAYLMDNLVKTDTNGNKNRVVLWANPDEEATTGNWAHPTIGFALWDRRQHGIKIKPFAWAWLGIAIFASAVLMVLLMLPFAQGINIMPIVRLYTGGLGTYPFTSVNAFNFWGLIHNIGYSWRHMEPHHVVAGVAIVIALVVGAIAALYRDHTRYGGRHYFFIVGALLALIFIFSVRMHERYLFPALIFFLLYFVQTREKWGLGIYGALSVTYFFNCTEILRWLRAGAHGSGVLAVSGPILSFANVVIGGVILFMLVATRWMERAEIMAAKSKQPLRDTAGKTSQRQGVASNKDKHHKKPHLDEPPIVVDPPPMKRRDYAYIFILIIVYSIIAFTRLGDLNAPQTSWVPHVGEATVIDFGDIQHVSEFQFRMGAGHDVSFTVETSIDHANWSHPETITPAYTDAYNWVSRYMHGDVRFVRIRPTSAGTSGFIMHDAAFRRPDGELIPIHSISAGADAIIDEQNTTPWTPPIGEEAIIDFGVARHITTFMYRMGAAHYSNFTFETSMDGVYWSPPEIFTPSHTDTFYWAIAHRDFFAQYIRIRPITEWTNGFRMQEVAFRGPDRELIPIHGITPGAEALVDEQQWVPLYSNFMNSAYFDEIFHPRAAYEFIHGLRPWENTHPHMGKNFIAMGVRAFGMTPFGWRFAGTLFGVLMVPLIYAFARFLLKSNNWALFAATIFTFDFMHFAQTRLATIDSYVTFFVIAMYFFIYLFIHGVERDSLRRKLVILLLCGISVGLAVASKWQGVYAVLGLPVLFFPALYRLYLRDRKQATTIFYSCFAFFIVIPLVIYLVSYIPFMVGYQQDLSWIRTVWNNQLGMYNYHAHLDVDFHPFMSVWWEWPLNLRPIFLYANAGIAPGTRSGISSFGNPAVWWGGFAAIGFVLFYAMDTGIISKAISAFGSSDLRRTERKPATVDIHNVLLWVAVVAQLLPWNGWPVIFRVAATAYIVGFIVIRKVDNDIFFLLVAFWAQFLPWVGIARLTWIYHFFPSVPFIVLFIAWVFKNYVKRPGVAVAYAFVVVALFALFYPVLSGLPISPEFVRTYLQWLPRWHMI